MLVKFSPSQNIFYPEFILIEFPETVPPDVVELPEDVMKEFYNAVPPKGMMRGVDKGMPTWVPVPVSEEPPERKKARILAESAAEIASLTVVIDCGDGSDETKEKLAKLKKYHAAIYLYDINSGKDWPTY